VQIAIDESRPSRLFSLLIASSEIGRSDTLTCGRLWQVDETCLLRGKRVYRYRTLDRAGQTADFVLRAKRDVKAVKAFLRKAGEHQGQSPQTITLGGYAASHRTVREMKSEGLLPEETKVRSSKCLNNVLEQDHRNAKSRASAMLGFKRFGNAATTLAGIELMHRICKGQSRLTGLHLAGTAMPTVWDVGPRCQIRNPDRIVTRRNHLKSVL
jgi:transposase-like protein